MRLSVPPRDDSEGDTSVWLITYSDMVTLLLAFFLLIYSFSVLGENEKKELVQRLNRLEHAGVSEEVKPDSQDLEKIAQDIADQFRKSGGEDVWVQASETEVTVGLPASITFDLGDAALNPQAREILQEVGTAVGRIGNTVRVEGHTDNLPIRTPSFPSNWHLSAARAQSVVRVFIERGVNPDRLQVVGYADTRPRVSNASEAGRRANRRTEIKLVRSSESLPVSK